MIQLGEIQTLQVAKKVEFGVYLYDGENQEERVLLPGKQVPEGTACGDEIEVFVYRDSKDRLIATTNRPKITLHAVERLRVAQVGKSRREEYRRGRNDLQRSILTSQTDFALP